ncbi:MAG TPA: ATP-binding protein [Ideonella sp.]|uniref:ATP-binding protein n=1 Tax=Ideonella sp. TaxID=1929293 RepID=UPI002E33018D|nr:ATP-binding protein [Ideonella sp.]HEX5688196.1 ATP-binding protein [Ideonella sp.]
MVRDLVYQALVALGCSLLSYASLHWSPLTGRPILDATAGLALAAVWVLGYHSAVAVGIGTLVGRWLWASALPACGHDDCDLWLTAGVHAATEAAQAMLGAWLLRRHHAAPAALNEPREILSFVVNGAAWPGLAGMAITTVYHVGVSGMPWAAAPFAAASLWAGVVLGVMIGAPIALTWLARPRRDWVPRRWPLTLTGVTSAALVHVGVAAVAGADARRSQNEFDHSAQLAVALTRAELHNTLQAVRAMQILFAQTREVSATEFRVAAAGWLPTTNEMQAIGWIDCEGPKSQAAAPRVRYVEPSLYRPPTDGGSWFVEPTVQAAQLRALQSGRPATSGRVDLGAPATGGDRSRAVPGVVVFQATASMWRPGGGCDHGVRGLVFATLPLTRLASQLTGPMAAPLSACLIDRHAEGRERVLLGAADCETTPAARRLAEPVTLADGQWELIVADRGRSEGRGASVVAGVSTAGMAGAAALMVLLLTVTGRARRIEDSVAEAEAARRAAESANMAKSNFLSRMSHELRTPLNAVLGFAQLLEMATAPALSPSHKRWATNIRQAGDHLLAMINDILDLSRIESDTLSLSIESLAVDSLVAETVTLVEQRAAERRISIQLDLSPQAERLYGDATRVRQVLANLLSNAVKYNRDGGEIHLAARRAGGMVEIEVRDTGLGLTATQMAQLFQPFNRLGRENSQVEGTGIGLVISRRLAGLMGGSLQVSSVPGTGSSFTLALPAGEHAERPLAPPVQRGDTTPAHPASALTSQRIHYVEDNPLNVEIVRSALAETDAIQLDHSATGQQCLDKLLMPGAAQPDLILLDLHLPDIDGMALLRRLKAHPATADIAVVVISADALEASVEAAMACGAVEFLTKPLDVARLRRALARHGRAAGHLVI